MKGKIKNSGQGKLVLIVLLCLVLLPLIWLLINRYEGAAPLADMEIPVTYVGSRKDVAFTVADSGRGLRSVRIVFRQGDKEVVLLEKEYPYAGFFKGGAVPSEKIEITLEPRKSGLTEGDAKIGVRAVDYSWRRWFKGNEAYREMDVVIDTRPPIIEVLSQQHNVEYGGSGLVIYRIADSGAKSGVLVGDHFFPGHTGYIDDPAIHMAFFALPHEEGARVDLAVKAEDQAGNASRVGFYHYVRKKKFKEDKINLSDAFLDSKMPEFDLEDAAASTLSNFDKFLKVNSDLRRKNEQLLLSQGQKTENTIYWEGAFVALPNAGNRANFADHREYFYNGKSIDRQFHMGIDLASLAMSPIPAANRGKVILTDNIGIYGNTVVLDHGFGLLSMYSHLSSIQVTVGQIVAKNETLGKSGTTGMAGGDHLHFGMMVHDIFVNPLEWLDASWIENNVMGKIKAVQSPPAAPATPPAT